MWKPMLPTLVEDSPKQQNWTYEVKYDGFRCGLEWSKDQIKLWSRNGTDLTPSFPEVIAWCQEHQELIEDQLPIFLDGEIVVLQTKYQAIFSLIQQRGRLKSMDKIKKASKDRPATFMVFDLLSINGTSMAKKDFKDRRKQLESLFNHLNASDFQFSEQINLVESFNNLSDIQDVVDLHQGEGIVVKQENSTYQEGKRTKEWLKIKNYRIVSGVITGWNTDNDYFDVEILDENELVHLGKVKNGFPDYGKNTLTTFIQQNGQKINGFSWEVEPSVCIDINCLNAKDGDIREPSFHQFRFDLDPDECTKEQVDIGLAQLPKEIEISKPDKYLFPEMNKRDYVLYLRKVAPILLPRLKDKRLTMIRYPDGIEEHSFYQKHLPDYAPDYIQTIAGDDDEEDILCQDLRSLLWFGNHAALEFHVPFHTIYSEFPDEMVFDLDPPSLKQFSFAVIAAQLIKDMVEHQGYTPYVKTSGRTGLQVHIPLEPKSMSFDDTREFMEAVANVLVEKYPDSFTIERLKKNRGNRLYVDYIQHAPGKTIVAPYSPRATKEATVATPLYWDEVNEQLDPRDFTIKNIPNRLKEKGCPFLRT
ncbi:DNA ligase D [Tenuibacillus multivorans]|uniref:DNA ligase (ATP) n=1 Tax=Tenuibacillus multivorans TaxID=237069 RepID=A0A1H0EKZ4_9BACI|nr:DNA ligase D [Tenuibacillus multivorans]GEL77114.1 bifunctional non-homologous end joining protein LigD [Tenuibacillus multivorans]SDN83042.1 bifunctional non-homologous end joining protein LigD [Tenuibacillus multivorans]